MRFIPIILALAISGTAQAQLQATQPATQPASPDIIGLVQQLGDGDFRTREAATRRLLEIGKPALSELKHAMQSDDPEVRSRAELLVKSIERPKIPGGLLDPDRPASEVIRISAAGNIRIIEARDGTRRVSITESPGAIELTIRAIEDGDVQEVKFHAKDAQELERDNPEAYAFYKRYNQSITVLRGGLVGVRGGGFRRLQGNDIIINNAADELDLLEVQLQEQMRTANLPEPERNKVLEQLDRLRAARDADPVNPQAQAMRLKKYFEQSDRLREMLAELKLPDPGAGLPPPQRARLGVQVVPVMDNNAGLLIESVVVGSRAEQIGLKRGDRILSIDGKPIGDVDDIRAALIQAKGPVKLKIERLGKEMEISEGGDARSGRADQKPGPATRPAR